MCHCRNVVEVHLVVLKEINLLSNGSIRAFCGQKAKYPEIEEKQIVYSNEKWQFDCAVSIGMCQLKALALERESGVVDFKASHEWIVTFLS